MFKRFWLLSRAFPGMQCKRLPVQIIWCLIIVCIRTPSTPLAKQNGRQCSVCFNAPGSFHNVSFINWGSPRNKAFEALFWSNMSTFVCCWWTCEPHAKKKRMVIFGEILVWLVFSPLFFFFFSSCFWFLFFCFSLLFCSLPFLHFSAFLLVSVVWFSPPFCFYTSPLFCFLLLCPLALLLFCFILFCFPSCWSTFVSIPQTYNDSCHDTNP